VIVILTFDERLSNTVGFGVAKMLVFRYLIVARTNGFRRACIFDKDGVLSGVLIINGRFVFFQKNVATLNTVAVMIIIYVFINSIREGIQFYQQGWPYLLDPTNTVTILLYFSAMAMIAPVLTNCLFEYQISFASITVFLSWFTLLLNLQR